MAQDQAPGEAGKGVTFGRTTCLCLTGQAPRDPGAGREGTEGSSASGERQLRPECVCFEAEPEEGTQPRPGLSRTRCLLLMQSCAPTRQRRLQGNAASPRPPLPGSGSLCSE